MATVEPRRASDNRSSTVAFLIYLIVSEVTGGGVENSQIADYMIVHQGGSFICGLWKDWRSTRRNSTPGMNRSPQTLLLSRYSKESGRH